MAFQSPHEKFEYTTMMAKVEHLNNLGQMKIVEAHARVTDETLKSVYLAGYKQCLLDLGVTQPNEGLPNG